MRLDEAPPAIRILARGKATEEASRGRLHAAPACRPAAPAPRLAIAPSRCNRCGACLRLGCGAIFDAGGESLVIDPSLCVGGSLCAPVCRARAIEARPG